MRAGVKNRRANQIHTALRSKKCLGNKIFFCKPLTASEKPTKSGYSCRWNRRNPFLFARAILPARRWMRFSPENARVSAAAPAAQDPNQTKKSAPLSGDEVKRVLPGRSGFQAGDCVSHQSLFGHARNRALRRKNHTTIWPASGNIAAELKKVPLERFDSFQEHYMDVCSESDGRIENIRKTDCSLSPLFAGITMRDAPDTPFLLSLQTRQASRPRALKIRAGGRMENLAVRSTER